MQRRAVLTGLGAAAAALPYTSPTAVWAQSPDGRLLAHVHPELRPIAKRMLEMTHGRGSPTAANLAHQRAQMAGFARKPSSDVPFEKRQVAGSPGQPPVTVYLVNARAQGRRPAILHTHGGGYVLGSAGSAIADLQALCKQLDCVAVSVDYRLAPETTFRGSIEDNYAALKWLHNDAAALGVDPTRIAVMGESAGGGHAALLAITARDRGEVQVCFQCLVYPMLDDRTGSTRKVPPHIGFLIWTPEANRFGWESFLGTAPGRASAPKGAVPARVTSVAGLPPAWIGVGSIDLFVDEDIDYAQRLIDAGVTTELLVVPGAFHGFDSLPVPTKVAERFNAAKIAALRRGFALA